MMGYQRQGSRCQPYSHEKSNHTIRSHKASLLLNPAFCLQDFECYVTALTASGLHISIWTGNGAVRPGWSFAPTAAWVVDLTYRVLGGNCTVLELRSSC